METANTLTPCFDAIPKGKRYALFPGKPLTPLLELLQPRVPAKASLWRGIQIHRKIYLDSMEARAYLRYIVR